MLLRQIGTGGSQKKTYWGEQPIVPQNRDSLQILEIAGKEFISENFCWVVIRLQGKLLCAGLGLFG